MLLSLCFIFYVFLGIYTYVIDRKSRINRAFCEMSICGSLWAIGYAMMLISTSINEAIFWRSIGAAGFTFFSGMWLYFAILLSSKDQKKISVTCIYLIFIPAVVYIVIMLMVEPYETVFWKSYGWINEFRQPMYQSIYNSVFAVYFIAGAILMYFRGKNSKKNRIKKQTDIVLICFIICASSAMTTDIFLPMMNIMVFPSGIIIIAIGMCGVYYAISKLKMMAITPKFLSEYIFDTVNDPIFILNEEFLIQHNNKAVIALTDFKYEELNGIPFGRLIQNKELTLNKILKHGYLEIKEVEFKKKNGDFIICELSGKVIYDEFKDILGIMIMLHDISQRKKMHEIEKNYTLKLEDTNLKLEHTNLKLINEIQERINAEEQIKHFVYYDALTELPNRKKMMESMNKLIENKNETFAVLFVDLDGYKNVNDNFGHQIGDKVLKITADKIKNILGENDTINRVGGDEFIILLGKLKYRNYIREVAEKIQEVLKKPITCEEKDLYVGASIGISIFPEHGTDADMLIRKADLAMYEVKYKGGYGYAEYSTKMGERTIDKLKIKTELKNALENNEFIIYYQPIIDLRNKEILSGECLIRWRHEGKIIYPGEFIPAAKQVGEMVAIDNWVLQNACIQCRKWKEKGSKNFTVSVNTSYTQLIQTNFISYIDNIIKNNSVLPECLNLEITEDEAMEAPEIIIEILSELKNMGIQISLDDFGTGYSSFSYINKLPIDKIKIDRSLIINLKDDYKNTMIIQAIIKMAHSLNIKVVAEGIETDEQFNILKELECDFIQGYLIGKPMDAVEFEKRFI